jgi:hypothetical protein
VYLECASQDVTLKKATIDCEGKDNTAENNQLENPTKYFDFMYLFENKKMYISQAVGIYITSLGEIFLEGLNPLLDLALQVGNLAIYKKTAMNIFKAYGVLPLKGNMLKSKQEKYEEISPEQVEKMLKGIMVFGQTLYGVETLDAAYPFFKAFKDN